MWLKLLFLLATTLQITKCEQQQQQQKQIEPIIATVCGPEQYFLQYNTLKDGKTSFTTTNSPGCVKDKLEILKKCQELYPSKDVANIVETSGKKLNQICGLKGCGNFGDVRVTFWRCLESPFQSDALLVPSPCIFDHIHNSSTCLDSFAWNSTALLSCGKRNFSLKSFAVLLPCGVGLFTGVEFVCCPPDHHGNTEEVEGEEDKEEDYEEDDDYYFDETTTTTTEVPLDTYLRGGGGNEHESYKRAEERLDGVHRQRMSQVMKDWEELEAKYQKMKKSSEPEIAAAEDFKKTITLRFQKTIKNLEEEGAAERQQLVGVHQQRVLSHLNARKKESMECYTQSLQSPDKVVKVQKCLEKLLRILHKDRHHTLSHYRHLLKSNMKQAEVEADYTLQRLTQISVTARQALAMLDRHPNLSSKLRPLMEDYILSLQGRDDVGSLLTATHESEERLLRSYKEMKSHTHPTTERPLTSTTPEVVNMETTTMTTTTTTEEPEYEPKEIIREQITSVRREVYHHDNHRPVFVVLTFVGIATMGLLLVVGVVLLKRRIFDHPSSHGFLEVNQSLSNPHQVKSPEEKHVANMQVNGYENPTYKYFEHASV